MQFKTFETREAASIAAAEAISALLERRLDAHEKASLVVSGGTTPSRCFAELANLELDWDNVHVVLSDERWVPADSDDSNEKLVRETLLTGRAAGASLLPVYREDTDPAARSEEIDQAIRLLPFPFACSLLGMGEDGHFASLFPDAGNLEAGLDPDNTTLCLPVSTAASPHPRISLTLSALSRSDEIILLIFGAAKRAVLESAASLQSELPVARLLLQKRAPVNVYWAP
ncbi:MAG: 6-phosphogluconolactonase [Woeseiaceae bacterium]|jgi:6-phosphogluconolactonase|nr:6-phosphogluconolactonase [Woeseiaceae bacterium]